AALSMIPSSTGAARAIGLVLPELNGKLDGMAVRVPTPNVSLVDLTAELEKPASEEKVNAAMKEAAAGPLQGILLYCEEPLVSAAFRSSPRTWAARRAGRRPSCRSAPSPTTCGRRSTPRWSSRPTASARRWRG